MNDAEPPIQKSPEPPDRLPHRPYPEVIYRFNDTLLRWWKTHKLGYAADNKVAFFTASFFSSHTRTFHWVSIYPTLWSKAGQVEVRAVMSELIDKLSSWNRASEELEQWRQSCAGQSAAIEGYERSCEPSVETREKADAWDRLLSDLPPGHLYTEAKSTILRAVKKGTGGIDPEAVHRAALALYSGYHHQATTNVEGVFVRLLELVGTKINSSRPQLGYLLGKTEVAGGGAEDPADWLHVDESISNLLAGANPRFHRWHNVRDPRLNRDEVPDKHEEVTRSRSQELIESLYGVLLGERSDPTKGTSPSFGAELSSRRHIALIPLYAVWDGDIGIGAIRAVILVWFETEELRRTWIGSAGPKLTHGMSLIASEVAASAEALALAYPIAPPYDLLSHFVTVLPFIQDWEAVWVVDTETNKAKYRFKRVAPQPNSAKWGWVREDCDACRFVHADGRDRSQCEGMLCLPTTPSEQIVPARCVDGDAWFMWWTNGTQGSKNFWSEDYIPEWGSDEESARCGRFAICFQFPSACHIPNSEEARRYLREVYVHQQLELMSVLLQKVRARRAALRSAVSAIMGRNMSHNIGSHVLARYSNAITTDIGPKGDLPDHRGEFLAYLQRRMDFLAEVATSDRRFWSQALSLRDQLHRLNIEACRKRYLLPKVDASKSKAPILLNYITGKDDLTASVEFGLPPDVPDVQAMPSCERTTRRAEVDLGQETLFACPGGEVGIHALFVILENIIRNSARHGLSRERGTVRLYVSIDVDESTDDLLRLRVIDPRTELDDGGYVARPADGGPPEKPVGGDRGLNVPGEINRILNSEPFLEASGAPNPKFWGVREIQTCAHYLLNIPLTELESGGTVLAGDTSRPKRYRVIEASIARPPNGKPCLEYRMWLQRPKLLAVVLCSPGPVGSARFGVRVISAIKMDATGRYEVDWSQAAGYNFVVVESGIKVPPNARMALPVRVLAGWQRSELEGLVTRAVANDASSLLWMERLHECVANQYKCHESRQWEKKEFWGVALRFGESGQAIRWPGSATTPIAGRIVATQQKDEDDDKIASYPFPSNWLPTTTSLSPGKSIGAAWIDHPKELIFKKFDVHNQENADSKPDWICVEGAFSGTVHAEYLSDALATGREWELLAAALPRVAIIDERLQCEAGTPLKGVKMSDWWSGMGIWVPNKDKCDLDFPEFNRCHSFLNSPSPRTEHGDIDFLVIHLTLLEKMRLVEGFESLDATLEKLISKTRAKAAERVIVTGRGVPTDAMAGVDDILSARYLPISTLLEYATIRPSKLGLMRVLWSAGRPRSRPKRV